MTERHSLQGTYQDPSRFTWEYVDNLRAFATKHETINLPHVVRLLAHLEAGARERHGERPMKAPGQKG